MKAITRGENQVVEMLLADPRTNINQCSGRAGLTPLHIACATGNLGRTLIDVARDSHPLLVPVLQKKKCSKSGKKISKERLKDDRDIDDLLSFIEGPCSKVTNEKKKNS